MAILDRIIEFNQTHSLYEHIAELSKDELLKAKNISDRLKKKAEKSIERCKTHINQRSSLKENSDPSNESIMDVLDFTPCNEHIDMLTREIETLDRAMPVIDDFIYLQTKEQYCIKCKTMIPLMNFTVLRYNATRETDQYSQQCYECEEDTKREAKKSGEKLAKELGQIYWHEYCHYGSKGICDSYGTNCSKCNFKFCNYHMENHHDVAYVERCSIHGCDGVTVMSSNRCKWHHNNKLFPGVGPGASKSDWAKFRSRF